MVESKTYPKIERSKKEKMIFFPDNIKEIQKDMEDKLETFYHYDLIKIPDVNQQIDDYDLFKKQNYAGIRKVAYGDWQKQFEILQEQGFDVWKNYCDQIKIKYPKSLVNEIDK